MFKPLVILIGVTSVFKVYRNKYVYFLDNVVYNVIRTMWILKNFEWYINKVGFKLFRQLKDQLTKVSTSLLIREKFACLIVIKIWSEK